VEFQEYKNIIDKFQKIINEKYLKFYSGEENLFQKIRENEYIFGNKIHRYRIKFEPKNHFITLNLTYQVEETIELFPHIYFEFMTFLESENISCFLLSDSKTTKKMVHNEQTIPMHPITNKTKKIYEMLETIQQQFEKGRVSIWVEQQSMFYRSELLEGMSWIMTTPKAEKIYIQQKEITSEEDAEEFFEEYARLEATIIKIKNKLIDYMMQLEPSVFYKENTFHIYKKGVPFELYITRETDMSLSYYVYRFHNQFQYIEHLEDAVNKAENDMKKYIINERIKAIVEGRK